MSLSICWRDINWSRPMATYRPRPIETSKVELSADLVALTEKLAENAHDNWARRRISEGWSWGTARDDKAKKHPCLVPYDQLPDSEKQYDRDTAIETLRAIIALGYRVKRVDE
jgi:ryanodine receptor 2